MRRKKSIKIKGDKKKVSDAIDLIIEQYKPILEIWSTLNPDRRRIIVDVNPRVGRLLQYFIEG